MLASEAQVARTVDLYRKLLQNFLQLHAQEADHIASAWAQGEADDARRMAHTVKGTAATLGAYTLSRHAAALETAVLQHDGAAVQAALAPVQAALQALCADLQTYFSSRAVAQPRVQREATPAEHAALLQGLQRLAGLAKVWEAEGLFDHG